MLALLKPLGCTHGVMGAAHARQLAHRYMPEVLRTPHAREPIIVDPEAFNRYIRARIELESDRSFGIVSQHRDEHMTMFVLHGHADGDVLKAVLWGAAGDTQRTQQIGKLLLWHSSQFGRRLTADLAADDLHCWDEATRAEG